MTDQPLLQIKRLLKEYPGTVAVDVQPEKQLSFVSGSVHALVGENGAGKSTMVSVLGGITPPDESDIALEGVRFVPQGVSLSRSRGIEMVRQDAGLVPTMTVDENLFLGREGEFRRVGFLLPRRRRALATAALSQVGLGLRPNQLAGSLDLETQKFVELARAIAFKPKVLIVDEMTASLSRRGVQTLFELLLDFARSGMLILYISHHLEEVFEICDHITVLKDGRVVTSVDPNTIDIDGLSTLMVGRSTKTQMFHEDLRPEDSPTVVLEVDNLAVANAFQGVSFELHSGEILGVAGLVGCGSEELGLAIFGSRAPSAGSMRISGRTYRPKNPHQAIARGVGHLPSDRDTHGLVLNLPIADNVLLASLPWLTTAGFRRPKRGLGLVQRLIDRLGIVSRGPSDLLINLSGGNRQRVVFAKWMVRKSRVLVLHNPTRGVDVGAKVELYRIIRSLNQEGQAILLISDDMEEVRGLSDRIIVMRRGRISGEFPKDAKPTEEQVVSLMI